MDHFNDKTGVWVIKEYDRPEELLTAVHKILGEIEQKELEHRGVV